MKSVTFENLKKQNYTMKESLRALKTNIQFCGDDICTIVVTSAMPNEGKSTVTMDLARSFSESGKRVLLIDTDMRKSVYVGRLRAVASDGREIYGLSHFLSGQKKLEDVLYGTTIPGLFMIFAGPSVPNPTEILEKKYFTELLNFAKEHFDYVLLDCAPIGAAIDAAVIAKHCDGAILVVVIWFSSITAIPSIFAVCISLSIPSVMPYFTPAITKSQPFSSASPAAMPLARSSGFLSSMHCVIYKCGVMGANTKLYAH